MNNSPSDLNDVNRDEATTMIDCLQQVTHRFSDCQDRIGSSSKTDVDHFWTASPPLREIVHRYAPVGLESQFEQLYGLLHPCLVARDNESNAAAFCLGHRGMGKGLLLDRCLQGFQEEIQAKNGMPMFRLVQVHGVLIPGNDVGLVVREMLIQLSKTAYEEKEHLSQCTDDNNANSNPSSYQSPVPKQPDQKRLKRTPRVDKMLRLRMSSFESNLQLLGETLKLARVDQIPILVVLDEVDAYLGGSSSSSANNSANNNAMDATKDRQLLLYHLLDRVATQGSNICLVGLTQQLNLKKQLEKRIKSRMEGTSKEIFLGACPSMNALVNVVLSHFASSNQEDNNSAMKQLRQHISHILTAPSPQDKHNDQSANSIQRRVWDTLEREYRLGRNVRWFNRIFSFALSLYRGEWIQYQSQCRRGNNRPPPRFEASHLLDALVSQGASMSVETSHHGQQQQRKRSNLVIMGGNAKQPPTAVDPRIQALLDLSAPQVALLLAARRILARDSQWNGETASPPPLTLGRILQEYSNFKANRYNRQLLWMAFQELIEQGLIRPAVDHTGGGPFQYELVKDNYTGLNEAEDVPLHLMVDTNREVMEALQSNLLECSTALKEWGRKTNT